MASGCSGTNSDFIRSNLWRLFRRGDEHYDALFPQLCGNDHILQRNTLTSLFALCVNGVAAILFISLGMVDWHYVLPMAIAAVVGGYGAAGLARRVGRVVVRRFVIIVGLAVSLVLFVRLF